MAFRKGNKSYELWPTCYQYHVAAISYKALDETDLSLFTPGEPADLWQCLKATQKSSLKRVAYEMVKGDVIYVKQGPFIVGKGMVQGQYKFRLNPNILDNDGYLWPHQVPVDWEPEFPSFRLLLGGESHTVLKLSEDHLAKLKTAFSFALKRDKDIQVKEGDLYSQTVRFRQRNRAIIEAKKRISKGVCEACEMNFSRRYRMSGKDCLHVHHKNPMAEREGASVTALNDLVLLCPNCHAVVHVFTPALTLEQLKRKIR
jgi:hypothetical protein